MKPIRNQRPLTNDNGKQANQGTEKKEWKNETTTNALPKKQKQCTSLRCVKPMTNNIGKKRYVIRTSLFYEVRGSFTIRLPMITEPQTAKRGLSR